jgi:uncharacterized protein YbjQ (UPF0145 family)
MQPTDWVVRIGEENFPAQSLAMVNDWIKLGRVNALTLVFSPDEKRWLTFQEVVALLLKDVMMTTTPSFEGYRTKRYIDIESVEVVIGTGIFSEITTGIADMFGQRSTAFENKMQGAKRWAFDRLKMMALWRDGNAVLGVGLHYTEFTGNRVGFIASGTIVEIEPIRDAQA